MNGMDAKAFFDDWREGLNKEEKDMTKEEMQKIIDDRDAYIEELEKVNTGLRYQLDMKRTEIGKLQDAVKEKVRGIESATDRYVQVSCANTKLVEENVALKKENDKMSGCIVDLQIKLMKAEDELKALKAERHDDGVDVTRYLAVLSKWKRAENHIRSLKSQLSIHEAMVEKLKILDEDNATMDALKKKNATLQYKIDALEGDIVDLANSYKKDLEEKKKENLDLDNNVKDMWATLRSLKKDNLKKDDEIKTFKFYVATLEDKLKKNVDYNNRLKKENVDLKDIQNFLSTKLEKRDEIIHDLNEENDELKAEIEVLLEKNYDLDNHVKNLVAQVETLDREKSELTNELNSVVDNYDKSAISLKKEVLKKDDEIRSLKQAVVDLNDKKNNLIDKLNDETRRLYLEKKKSSAFEQEIDRLLGLCKNKIDVAAMHPSMGVDLNLSEVKKDIEEKQAVIDALKDLDARITWITDHMENYEAKTGNELLNAFNRICKLEEAQPKKSSKKTSKKAQFSTVS